MQDASSEAVSHSNNDLWKLTYCLGHRVSVRPLGPYPDPYFTGSGPVIADPDYRHYRQPVATALHRFFHLLPYLIHNRSPILIPLYHLRYSVISLRPSLTVLLTSARCQTITNADRIIWGYKPKYSPSSLPKDLVFPLALESICANGMQHALSLLFLGSFVNKPL